MSYSDLYSYKGRFAWLWHILDFICQCILFLLLLPFYLLLRGYQKHLESKDNDYLGGFYDK